MPYPGVATYVHYVLLCHIFQSTVFVYKDRAPVWLPVKLFDVTFPGSLRIL